MAAVARTQPPWGGDDSPALVSAVESTLERDLSRLVRAGSKGLFRRDLAAGETLLEQDEPGTSLFLILDGMLDVQVDGDTVAQVGPGAVVGERASIEGGTRTSTVCAASKVHTVVIPAESIDDSSSRSWPPGTSGSRRTPGARASRTS